MFRSPLQIGSELKGNSILRHAVWWNTVLLKSFYFPFQASASESRRSTSVGVEGRTKRFLLNESGTKRKSVQEKPQKELVVEVPSTKPKVGSFYNFFSPQRLRVNSSCLQLLPSIFFLSFHLLVLASEENI